VDRRMVDFVHALRASGVRVSLAESEDAFRAASQVGVADREEFRNALRLTLVKEEHHIPPFDRLFPLFFGADEPPAMDDALGGMGGEDAEQLREALKKLFHDPHFNVMDGLDTYIDDYSKPDPLPAAMLATLRQAQKILEWAKETPEETEAKRAAASADPLPVALPDQAGPAEVVDGQPPAVAVELSPVEQLQDAEQVREPSVAAERKS